MASSNPDYTLTPVKDEDLPEYFLQPVGGLEDAHQALDLTPQEKSLYNRHLDNLYGPGGVDNSDGSRSSLYAGTFGVEDKTYILPHVYDGKILNSEEAFKKAKEQGLDTFPSYNTQEEADKRYGDMHKFMEKDTKEYLGNQNTKAKPMNEWTSNDIFNNQLYEETMRASKAKTRPSEEEMFKMSPNQLRQYVK